MICQRCEGLMVLERCDDLTLGSAGYEVPAWRCLNCGAIVDTVIADHRQTAHKTELDSSHRRRLKKPVMAR